MVKFDNDISAAAVKCLREGIPFCLFMTPECEDVNFFANPSMTAGTSTFQNPSPRSEKTHEVFFIGDWLQKSDRFHFIHNEMDAADVLQYRYIGVNNAPSTVNFSISKSDYLNRIEEVIDLVGEEHLGKVVISRAVNRPGITPEQCLEKLPAIFEAYPRSFRHLYYTSSTGAWLGASPELLLHADTGSGTFSTMSLAGTRATCNEDDPWSAKDIDEQRIVTRYIQHLFDSVNLRTVTSHPFTLTTGNLQHICTLLEAKTETPHNPFQLIDLLNPTPALCGFPRNRAEEIIALMESHQRRCYGGVVGVMNKHHTRAYVNLRCINFDKENTCAFAGGGILAQSHPLHEWEETQRKLQSITRFLS